MKYLYMVLIAEIGILLAFIIGCSHSKPPLYKWKPKVIEQKPAEKEEVTEAVFGELKSLERVKRQ